MRRAETRYGEHFLMQVPDWLLSVDTENVYGYIHREVKTPREERFSQINGQNHAVYIGKIPKERSKWREIFDMPDEFQYEPKLYTREVITALTKGIAYYAEPGTKIRFVICRALSELFNGTNDVENSLTDEEETKLIREEAKRILRNADMVEVVSMEGEHKAFFDILRRSVDSQTGKVDPKKAFEGEEVSDSPNTLLFAKAIYAEALASADFRERIRQCVPSRIKYGLQTADDQLTSEECYAISEIAIRLADILNGRFIHGGVDRQGIYDGIIQNIIRGRSVGKLKQHFTDKHFEVVHLVGKENPYDALRKRTNARIRAVVQLSFPLLLVAAGVAECTAIEHRKELAAEEALTVKMEESMPRFSFVRDLGTASLIAEVGKDAATEDVKNKEKLNAFTDMIDSMLIEMQCRYDLMPMETQRLREIFVDFCLSRPKEMSDVYRHPSRRSLLIDKFFNDHPSSLKGAGIRMPREPFENFARYRDTFITTAGSTESGTIHTAGETFYVEERGGIIANPEPIGCIVEADWWTDNETKHIYVYRRKADRGGPVIVTFEKNIESTDHISPLVGDPSTAEYSIDEGRRYSGYFIGQMEAHNVVPLIDLYYDGYLYNDPNNVSKIDGLMADTSAVRFTSPTTFAEYDVQGATYVPSGLNYAYKTITARPAGTEEKFSVEDGHIAYAAFQAAMPR